MNPQPPTLNFTRYFLAYAPWYAQLLARLPKVADRSLSVPFALGWRERPYLRYHPTLLEKGRGDVEWLATCLQEELLHLLLQHPRQARDYPEAWAFHLAADLEVRQYLPGLALAGGNTTLFKRLHLPDYADVQTVYRALLRLRAGLPSDALLPGWTASPLTRAAHRYWPDEVPAPAWQAWWQLQSALLDNQADGAQAALLNRLSALSERPSLPWTSVLKRFVTKAQRTKNRSSLRRPSRRFGTFPGTRRKRTARLAVVVDTSGSIDELRRRRFFLELQALLPLTQEIMVVEADYQVRATYEFTGALPPYSRGGGRTDFDPALRFLNAQSSFDGVIYLTDGEAAAPAVSCAFPLLWIIHAPQLPETVHWPGQVVHWRG